MGSMANPVIMNVSRDIYEAFWRHGHLPLTRTIRVRSISDHGEAEVLALACDIPAELLKERTIDELQSQFDAIQTGQVLRCSMQ